MGRKPRCNLEQFKSIVKYSIKADMRGDIEYRPFLIEGPAGIGKTQSIKQMVGELTEETGVEFGFYQFDSATRTATDIWGIPYPKDVNGEKVLTWLKDEELPREDSIDFPSHGIFYCTELTSVQDEQLKVALLELLNEGKMAGYKLPRHWYVVADGNGKNDGNVYTTLTFPIRNRLGIMEGYFDKQTWLSWCRRSGVHPSVISYIEMLPSNNLYLTYNPELEDLSDGATEDNYVCATPRSWEAVSNNLKMYEEGQGELGEDLLEITIKSLVGDDVGGKFFEYYRNHSQLEDDSLSKVLNTPWSQNQPLEPLPPITEDLKSQLKHYLKSGENVDALINAFFYLSENVDNIDGKLNIILGGKSADFKKEFNDKSIRDGNLKLYLRISRYQPKEDDMSSSIFNGLGWEIQNE